jgi:protein-disulfide isomerase-like protein with CxxC motif
MHRAQYGHYEQGRNAVSFVVMLRIAKALGVSAQELADAVEKAMSGQRRR